MFFKMKSGVKIAVTIFVSRTIFLVISFYWIGFFIWPQYSDLFFDGGQNQIRLKIMSLSQLFGSRQFPVVSWLVCVCEVEHEHCCVCMCVCVYCLFVWCAHVIDNDRDFTFRCKNEHFHRSCWVADIFLEYKLFFLVMMSWSMIKDTTE